MPDPNSAGPASIMPIESVAIEDLLNLPVVTASGKQESRALASANVVVFDRQEIAQRGWRSVAEVLAATPGLYVTDDLEQVAVGVRGVTPGLGGGTRIVRVMINGVPVNFRPDLTAFLGPEFIPMDAVERVEIAKGPLSALHGANAFLATVNVITRTPAEGVHGTASARWVSVQGNEGFGGSGMISARSGDTDFLAAFTAESVDRSGLQVQQTFDGQDPAAARYAHFFGDKSRGDISAPLGAYARLHTGSDRLGTLTAEAGFQRQDTMAEFRLNSVLTHSSRIDQQNFWSNLRYEKALTDTLRLDASLGFARGTEGRDYQLQLTGNPAFSYQPHLGYSAVYGTVEAHYTPVDWLDLTVGLDAEQNVQQVLYWTQVFNAPVGTRQPGDTLDLISPDDPRTEQVYDVGAFAQATAHPFTSLPNLHFTGNARVDQIRYGPVSFPVQVSLRGAAAYEWNPDLVTKLVVGRAFQTPSGLLMFAHPGFGAANNVIGNVTLEGLPLRPQTATSAEAIFSLNVFGKAAIEAGAFMQLITDKIEFVQRSSDFSAQNRGDMTDVGLEASIHAELGRVRPFANLSFLQQLDSQTAFGAPASQYPFFWGIGGTAVDVPEAHVQLTGEIRYVGARGATQSNTLLNDDQPYALPPFFTVDLTASTMNLSPFGEGSDTRLSISVKNLFDDRHSEPGFGGIDTPSRGRTIFAELRQSL